MVLLINKLKRKARQPFHTNYKQLILKCINILWKKLQKWSIVTYIMQKIFSLEIYINLNYFNCCLFFYLNIRICTFIVTLYMSHPEIHSVKLTTLYYNVCAVLDDKFTIFLKIMHKTWTGPLFHRHKIPVNKLQVYQCSLKCSAC